MKWEPGYQRNRKRLLGFTYSESRNGFITEVVYPFRPSGLIIWDAPPLAVVNQCIIGNQYQIVASYDPAPAKFFSLGKNYEQIAALLDEGIELPNWCDFDPIEVSQRVLVQITNSDGPLGPKDGIEVCMWGLSLERVGDINR